MPFEEMINNLPEPLDAGTQEYYLNELANGNKVAREALIMHNLYIIKFYLDELSDLTMEQRMTYFNNGVKTLVKCIDNYNPNKKVKFKRHLSYRIFLTIKHGSYDYDDRKFLDHSKRTVPVDSMKMYEVGRTQKNYDFVSWLEHKEELEKLGSALGKLFPSEQKLIRAVYFDDLSLEEVSTRMKISEKETSELLKQCLKKLRNILENSEVDFSFDILEKLNKRATHTLVKTINTYTESQLAVINQYLPLLNFEDEQLLKDFLGLKSISELAKELDRTEANVRFRIKKALKNLLDIASYLTELSSIDDISPNIIDKLVKEPTDEFVVMVSRLDKIRLLRMHNVLNLLPTKSGEALKMYLGLDETGVPKNINQISSLTKDSYSSMYRLIFSSLKAMQEMISFYDNIYSDGNVASIMSSLLLDLKSPIKNFIKELSPSEISKIHDILEDLPMNVRIYTLYFLGFYDGTFKTVGEISKQFKLSYSTVESHVLKGLRAINDYYVQEVKSEASTKVK